jgi:hypothetical protein
MRLAVYPVVAFTDNTALVYQQRPYHWVRRYPAGAQLGQLQAALHKKFVVHRVHALNVGYVCKSIIFRPFA